MNRDETKYYIGQLRKINNKLESIEWSFSENSMNIEEKSIKLLRDYHIARRSMLIIIHVLKEVDLQNDNRLQFMELLNRKGIDFSNEQIDELDRKSDMLEEEFSEELEQLQKTYLKIRSSQATSKKVRSLANKVRSDEEEIAKAIENKFDGNLVQEFEEELNRLNRIASDYSTGTIRHINLVDKLEEEEESMEDQDPIDGSFMK